MKTKNSWKYLLAVTGMLIIFTQGCEKDDHVEILFAGGIGTRADPYLIATPEQLDGVRHNLDKHFKQVADIDLGGYVEGRGWQPIGDYYNRFTGTFDGNGYKIINLTIDWYGIGPPYDKKYLGLFGLTDKSTIINAGLINTKILGGGYSSAGGLVGLNDGEITDSYAAGNFSGEQGIGGLVGLNKGVITNCYAIGVVSGSAWVGGLVGMNEGNITNCFATTDVLEGETSGNSFGGLVGMNSGYIINSYAEGKVHGWCILGGLAGGNSEGDIINCFAKGDVSGESAVGGLVGFFPDGNITNSYATGNVSGDYNVGGLVGEYFYLSAIIEYSYYDKETTGQDDTGKGIPKTTAEMMQQSTFESWDFTNIWRINEGNSYPYLRWQE